MTKNKVETDTQTTAQTRQMMLSDLRHLERLLNTAHYNVKANLKLREIGFKGYEAFPQPRVTLEQSRVYLINNLITIKEQLNSFELGDKIELDNIDTDIPF